MRLWGGGWAEQARPRASGWMSMHLGDVLRDMEERIGAGRIGSRAREFRWEQMHQSKVSHGGE